MLTLQILALYALAGGIFALAFLGGGYRVIAPEARGASWGARLLWLPGAAVLWPILAVKWWRRWREARA